MLTTLSILCLLIWLPILLFQINRRGFLVLVIWFFIAPVATNIINYPNANPFFQSEAVEKNLLTPRQVLRQEPSIDRQDLLDPTRTLLVIFLVVYIVGSLLQKKPLLPLDRTEIWMGLFSLIVVASALFHTDRPVPGLHVAADAFIIPFLAYYLVRRLVTSEDHIRRFTQIMGYMGLYLFVICLIERLTHGELMYRLGGPFKSSNILPAVMAVVFFWVLLDSLGGGGGPGERQALPRGIQMVVLYLAPVIILLTLGRGNWVGFLLSVGVFLFLGRRIVSSSRKFRAIGLALMLVPMIVVSVPLLVPKQLIEKRVANVGNVYTRIAAWKILARESYNAPILGIGINNSRYVLTRTKEQFRGISNETTPHNSFLTLLIEQGVVGLLLYLAIVGSIMKMGLGLYWTGTHSRDKWTGITVIAVMIGYLAPSLFANIIHTIGLTHIYVYGFMGAIAGRYGPASVSASSLRHLGMNTDMLAIRR